MNNLGSYQYATNTTRSPSFSGVNLSRGPGLSSTELGNSSSGVYGTSSSRYISGNGNSSVVDNIAHMELREEAINKTSILLLEDNKKQINTLRSEIGSKEALVRQLEDQNRVLKDTSSYQSAEKEKIVADFKAANQKLANTETELRVKEIMLDRAQKDSTRQRSILENSIKDEQEKNVSLQRSLLDKEQQLTQLNAELNSKRQQLAVIDGSRSSLQTDVVAKDRLISVLNTQLNAKDAQIATLTKESQVIPTLQFEVKRLNDDLNRYRMYEDMYRKENTKSVDLESMLRAKESSSKQDADRITSLNSLIASLKNRTDQQEQTINQLLNEKKQNELELTSRRTQNANLEAELATAKMTANNLGSRIKDMDDYIKDLDIQIEGLKRENQNLNNSNLLKASEIENKKKVIEEAAQSLGCSPASANDVPSRVRDLINNNENLKAQFNHCQMDAAAKGGELMRLKEESARRIDDLSKSLNGSNVDKDILNSRVNQLNNELATNYVPKLELEKVKAELASERSRSQVLSSGMDKLKSELDTARGNEASAMRNLSQVQREKELGDTKLQALQQRVDNLELHNSLLAKDNSEKSSKVQQLEGETNTLRSSLSSVKSENNFLNSQNAQLSSKVNEFAHKSSYLDSQVRTLESSLHTKEMEKMALEQEQKAKAEKRFTLLEQRVKGEEELNTAISDIIPNTNMSSSRSVMFSPKLSQSICSDNANGMISPGRLLESSRVMNDDELTSIINEIDRSIGSKKY